MRQKAQVRSIPIFKEPVEYGPSPSHNITLLPVNHPIRHHQCSELIQSRMRRLAVDPELPIIRRPWLIWPYPITREGRSQFCNHMRCQTTGLDLPKSGVRVLRSVLRGDHPLPEACHQNEERGQNYGENREELHVRASQYHQRTLPSTCVHVVHSPLEPGSWNFSGAWCLVIGDWRAHERKG